MSGNLRKICKQFIIGGLVMLMCFSMFGCGKKKVNKEIEELKALPAGTMLFDYYEEIVGTESENGHDEIVVLTYDTETVAINVYHKGNQEGATETCTKYLASAEIVDTLYGFVDSYEMTKWESMQSAPLVGIAMVMKFRADGQMMRVTAETITEKYGEKPFGDVESALLKAIEGAELAQ